MLSLPRKGGNYMTINIAPPEGMELIYQRPVSLANVQTHYCPGCTHGVAHRLLAEVVDELGLQDRVSNSECRVITVPPRSASQLYPRLALTKAGLDKPGAIVAGHKIFRLCPPCIAKCSEPDSRHPAVKLKGDIDAVQRPHASPHTRR